MPDKKLTDNDIKKALECCSKKICKQCPNFSEDIECSEKLIILALDLINRLQAENEELKSAINGFRGYEDKIKAEAYKEFAERLKTEYAKGMNWFKKKESYYVDVGDIDNLLKELVGDT